MFKVLKLRDLFLLPQVSELTVGYNKIRKVPYTLKFVASSTPLRLPPSFTHNLIHYELNYE